MDWQGAKGLLERLSLEVYSGGKEVVAGSREDAGEAERIRGLVEGVLGVTARLVPVEVEYWRGDALLSPRPRYAILAPNSPSTECEGRVVRVAGDPSDPLSWRGREGRIALVDEPPSPDDLKASVLLASEAGFECLLVRGPPRRIVVNGYWGYSFTAGSPAPIPAIHVPPDYSPEEASISVSSEWAASRSYIIEADTGGREAGGLVMVGAHYDRWLTGFTDNSLGVAQAIVSSKLIGDQGRASRLVVFSAEETGVPGHASWYWAWGSRFYSRQLSRSGLSEEVASYLNFDMACGPGLRVSGSPQLIRGAPMDGVDERCCECPECDSYSIAIEGIPTVSIHSFWNGHIEEFYHTPMDTPDRCSMESALLAVRTGVSMATSSPRWQAFSSMLRETLGRGPLMARRAYYIIESASRRLGWSAIYRSLAREFLEAVHYGSYRWDPAYLEALWFPEVAAYLRLVGDLRRGSRVPSEVWVAGRRERIVYSLYSPPRGRPLGARGLAGQAEEAIRSLTYRVEEVIEGILR